MNITDRIRSIAVRKEAADLARCERAMVLHLANEARRRLLEETYDLLAAMKGVRVAGHELCLGRSDGEGIWLSPIGECVLWLDVAVEPGTHVAEWIVTRGGPEGKAVARRSASRDAAVSAVLDLLEVHVDAEQ